MNYEKDNIKRPTNVYIGADFRFWFRC